MASIHDWSIKTKLSLIVILSCMMATTLCFAFFVYWEIEVIKNEIANEILMRSEIIRYDCAAAMELDQTVNLEDALAAVKDLPNFISFRLYKEKDEIFCTYPESNDINPKPLFLDKKKDKKFTWDYLHTAIEVDYATDKKGKLELIFSLNSLYERIQNLLLTTLVVLLVSLLFANLMAMQLMRWITRPFTHVSNIATEIARERNYSLRAQKWGNDEIGRFIDVFNGMLDQIQKQDYALRRARDELEERVERRTAALNTANQELQEANERLQDLDKMKSAFVSQASHDLRTPLTTIKLNMDNLMRGVGGTLSDKQKRVLERAQGAVNRLTHLINDVLDLNRIESGRMILDKTDTPFDMLVRDVIHENQPIADQKRIQVQYQTQDGEYIVHVDVGKMERVVGELIGNAIKYTPEGGRIEASIRRDNNGGIIFAVSDTGIGMTREECSKIWERFYRTPSSQLFAVGSGLGLSIAKELIQMHGGKLTVDSEKGKGSTFTLILPDSSK